MDVSFLSIMYVYYEHVYLYMCVIHCRNGCTDMLYYCVIFVILNKKHLKKKKKKKKKNNLLCLKEKKKKMIKKMLYLGLLITFIIDGET